MDAFEWKTIILPLFHARFLTHLAFLIKYLTSVSCLRRNKEGERKNPWLQCHDCSFAEFTQLNVFLSSLFPHSKLCPPFFQNKWW